MTDQSQSGSVGAGQLEPTDYNSQFYVIAFIVRQMMAQLQTMMPVQVIAVHPGSGAPPQAGTVDVQLLVSLIDGANNATQRGVVYGLPYFRLQGGKWAIIVDPAVNDFGFIVSASRDISNVVKSPGIAVPGSKRKYSYSDGIYIGGALNTVPSATVWCKSDGTVNITDANNNTFESTSAGFDFKVGGTKILTLNSSGAALHGTLNADNKITATDFSDGTVTSYKTHTHSGVTTGSGSSGPPTPGS